MTTQKQGGEYKGNNMVLVPIKCPHCGSTHIRKNGTAKTGKQRYLCLSENGPRWAFPDVY
jgi:predicted RNA-binding Zn-ribbon protein involved in translation (DUF1610 family)